MSLRVELGSGYHPTDGFVHIDANPNATDVDVVWDDLTALPFYDTGQVDELRAVDVAEHVSYRDTGRMFVEWGRVLRPGGRLFVQVPDAGEMLRWWSECPERLVERVPAELPQTPLSGLTWRLLGGHLDGQGARVGDDFRWNAHYAMFDRRSLQVALADAGFLVVKCETNGHPNLSVWAVRR